MTRRPAAERHRDSAPPTGHRDDELLDVLMAYHHPTRRWLTELLDMEGPASVGRLAARTGLAVGSVSHHLKALHRYGFVEPAPELARDTRESWWRSVRRGLSWSADDFEAGTAARRIAEAAEAENFRHQLRAVHHWLTHSHEVELTWRRAAGSTDTIVAATVDQLADLQGRMNDLILTWSEECLEDLEVRPDPERRPSRVIARVFPTGPVRP